VNRVSNDLNKTYPAPLFRSRGALAGQIPAISISEALEGAAWKKRVRAVVMAGIFAIEVGVEEDLGRILEGAAGETYT
jgi:hypothetical protein